MEPIMIIVFGIFSIILIVMILKTLLFKSKQLKVEGKTFEKIDSDEIISRLSESIQLKTISDYDTSKINPKPYLDFHDFLETAYPLLHQKLEKQIINQYSLLYTWHGKNPQLKPIAFLAHFDVVPVEPETEQEWIHKPYSGKIADGFVWGRGTLDMKGTLMAIMESVEKLIEQEFQPERTIYLAFGHDEEIGGNNGAGHISRNLKTKGVQLSYTLDEGMMILNPLLSPSNKTLALIGIAEKGYLTLKITIRGEGGHSSMPTTGTSIGKLAKIITRLEEYQMKATLVGPAGLMFDYIGPEMPFFQKLIVANRWAFRRLILHFLSKSKTTNAMIRTTTAPTIIKGGIKANVLPGKVHLIVNFRILPGDSVQKVITHVKKVIDDNDVTVEMYNNIFTEPTCISDISNRAFSEIQKTICQIFPDTSVAPGLVLAETDSKHYEKISDNNFRFAPFTLGPDDTARIHGINERISIQGYLHAIQFYRLLIENSAGSA